ncbi:hypothetical protein AB0M47_33720 [Hamadaea sp. NPDC051192]
MILRSGRKSHTTGAHHRRTPPAHTSASVRDIQVVRVARVVVVTVSSS